MTRENLSRVDKKYEVECFKCGKKVLVTGAELEAMSRGWLYICNDCAKQNPENEIREKIRLIKRTVWEHMMKAEDERQKAMKDNPEDTKFLEGKIDGLFEAKRIVEEYFSDEI